MSVYNRMRKPAVYDKNTMQTIEEPRATPKANRIGNPDANLKEKEKAIQDLANHVPIDTSIADINAPDSIWTPDDKPVPESSGLFHDSGTGRSGSLTPDNIWNVSNPDSIKGRVLWNTRKLTHDQAFKYAAMYKQPIIIDRNKQIEDAWNALPIYTQDSIHASGFPDDKENIQKFLWQKAYDEATIQATKEIADGKMPTKQELDAFKWSPVDDVQTLKIALYDPRSDPHKKEYDPKFDPNNPAYDKNQDKRLKPKTVVQLLSESKTPYKVVLGRVFWDTGRYTFNQAEKYLNNKGYIEPYQEPECVIDPWKETPADLPRYLLDYLSCSFNDFIEKLKEIFGIVETAVIYGALAALIIGGYIVYKNRRAIKSASYTSADYASNLIPGRQYYRLKKQEAARRGISVSKAIGEDAGKAYNPVGLINDLKKEYVVNNPDSFTAGLVSTAPQIENILPASS